MVKIVLIIVAVVGFFLGLWLIFGIEGTDDYGTILVLMSALLFFIAYCSPIEVEAHEQVGYTGRGAGITKVMDEMLYNAMHDYYVIPEVEENEIELLATLMTAEVGYSQNWTVEEYEKALYLTGSVVINRMNSDSFPNTLLQVIYQRGQYACTWDGNMNKEYDDIAWEVAEDLLANGTTIPENVVFQAQFKQGSGVYDTVRNMVFCYE